MTPTWYLIVALSISTVALVIATMNYRRKSGSLVRGIFSIGSSIECNDLFVNSLILENLKDRAITVYAIYLRIGHNYYITLEKFEDKPLLLKAFETYQKEYGPIQFYGINTDRIDLNKLLQNPKVKRRLVLSTGDGKYVVPSPIKRWHPVGDFFKNHLTAIIHPVQITFKGKYLGSNIRYVVEFTGENGNEEIVLIHPEDFRVKKFRNFTLTKETLNTKESLETHLQEQMDNGKLICKKIVVHDTTLGQKNVGEFYNGKLLEAPYCGRFQYYIAGRLFTWSADRKLKRENKIRTLASQSKSFKSN